MYYTVTFNSLTDSHRTEDLTYIEVDTTHFQFPNGFSLCKGENMVVIRGKCDFQFPNGFSQKSALHQH